MKQFIQIHKNGFKLLKILQEMNRNMIPLSILGAILNSIKPFISIVFVARIVDFCIEGNYRAATQNVFYMIGLALFVALSINLIEYYLRVNRNMLILEMKIATRRKCMELDYEIVENNETKNVIRNTESAAQYGMGLSELAEWYTSLLQYMLGMVIAFCFTVEFVLARGSEGGIYNLLTNPWIDMLLLLGSFFIVRVCTKRIHKNIDELNDYIAKEHYKTENGLGYWANCFSDDNAEMTFRLCDMKKLATDSYNKYRKQSIPVFAAMLEGEQKGINAVFFENTIFTMMTYVVAVSKTFVGAITIGSFAKYTGAILQLLTGFGKIFSSQNSLGHVVMNLESFLDFMEKENQYETGTLHVEKRLDNRYEIEFHDVSFAYPGSSNKVLNHVDFKSNTGEKLAVVGENGAGKSTFIKLLCRLYEPMEGYISLNGIDIRKYDYQEYLSLFGVVFQNFHLFGVSISENIAMNVVADKLRVKELLKQVELLDYVENLPEKENTIVRNGDESAIDVSGGQAQKLSIARAMYKDAPFVILDEPTAALDPISESKIYEKFHDMVKDKSALFVSHRMSSCKFCDNIIVFDKGSIIEHGNHSSLLKLAGKYAAMWKAQAGYYEVSEN